MVCKPPPKKKGYANSRLFVLACQKIVQQRLSTSLTCLTPTNSRPSTPSNHFARLPPPSVSSTTNNGFTQSMSSPSHGGGGGTLNSRQTHTLSASTHHLHRQQQQSDKVDPLFRHSDDKWASSSSTIASSHGSSQQALVVQTENNNVPKFSLDNNAQGSHSPGSKEAKDLPTPSSTPTTSRKSRRRSNLFTPSKKCDDKLKNGGDFGSGRAIPLKQGYLYKRSSKPLNKDWKKKYVTLCDDGRLTYHPSLHVSKKTGRGRVGVYCLFFSFVRIIWMTYMGRKYRFSTLQLRYQGRNQEVQGQL